MLLACKPFTASPPGCEPRSSSPPVLAKHQGWRGRIQSCHRIILTRQKISFGSCRATRPEDALLVRHTHGCTLPWCWLVRPHTHATYRRHDTTIEGGQVAWSIACLLASRASSPRMPARPAARSASRASSPPVPARTLAVSHPVETALSAFSPA